MEASDLFPPPPAFDSLQPIQVPAIPASKYIHQLIEDGEDERQDIKALMKKLIAAFLNTLNILTAYPEHATDDLVISSIQDIELIAFSIQKSINNHKYAHAQYQMRRMLETQIQQREKKLNHIRSTIDEVSAQILTRSRQDA